MSNEVFLGIQKQHDKLLKKKKTILNFVYINREKLSNFNIITC